MQCFFTTGSLRPRISCRTRLARPVPADLAGHAHDEALYQGKIGLVVGKGPLAFTATSM